MPYSLFILKALSTVHINLHFVLEDDWKKIKLNKLGKQKLDEQNSWQ